MHAFLDEELSRFIVSGSITNFSGSSSRILLKLLTSSICSSCNYHHHYSSMNLVCSLDLSCTDGYRRVGERRSVPKFISCWWSNASSRLFFSNQWRASPCLRLHTFTRTSFSTSNGGQNGNFFVQFYAGEPGYISHDFIPRHFFVFVD